MRLPTALPVTFADPSTVSILMVSILALSVVCLMPSVVSADGNVGISFSPQQITINTSSIGFVDITVTNNGNVPDTFNVVVFPSQQGGITVTLPGSSNNIFVNAHSNATMRIFLTVGNDAEEQNNQFVVTAKSINFDNVIGSAYLVVGVQRTSSVYISELALDKNVLGAGDCVNITSSITNTGSLPVNYNVQAMIQKGPETVKLFDEKLVTIGGESVRDVSERYCFDRYALAGEYLVTSTLRTQLNKFVDRPSVKFNISETHDLVYSKSVQYTPFAQIRTVTVKNDGNVIEKDFLITETVSNIAARLFFPVDKVDSTEYQADNVVYGWKVAELLPNREVTIRYEIRFVSIWITGVVIALIVFLAFNYAYKPRISKKATISGTVKKGTEVPVTIEVKNSTLYEIRNITITDNIPPLAALVEKFDTLPPQTKKTETGTELSWKIKSLRPLEERVLTYRIRPTMEMTGSLKLPRAYLEYLDGKNEKKTEPSGTVDLV